MEEFLEALKDSFENRSFIKMTFSKVQKDVDLKVIYVRLIKIKNDFKFSCTYRFKDRDEVKNHTWVEMPDLIRTMFPRLFKTVTLFLKEKDLTLMVNNKFKVRLLSKKATMLDSQEFDHDRQKIYPIAEDAPFLELMHVATNGRVRKGSMDKYKQINHFISIIADVFKAVDPVKPFQVADMGAGKGYLTFALFQYLKSKGFEALNIKGFELRTSLTDQCNEWAAQLGYQHLSFEAKDIQSLEASSLDCLIALHACDIATDIAIAKGIRSKAKFILTAPCCHKQLRRSMQADQGFRMLTKHGILAENQAELLTDGIRALVLEAFGYKTKVIEFIPSEHTPKNKMIIGIRKEQKNEVYPIDIYVNEIKTLKDSFGFDRHFLVDEMGLTL